MVKNIRPELDEMLKNMVEEHVVLHQLFDMITKTSDLPAHLDTLGKTLEKHVRTEEREIFPLIQECCTEEMLGQLAVVLQEP